MQHPARMSQTDVQARQQLLDALGEATDDLAEALTSLGAAYEQLDDQQADRLEQQLFRPVQRAYGSASTRHCRLRLSRTLRGGVLDFGQPRAKSGSPTSIAINESCSATSLVSARATAATPFSMKP